MNEVHPKYVDCSSDVTQPDVKYGTVYWGAYRSSKDAFLKKSDMPDNTIIFVGFFIQVLDKVDPADVPLIFNIFAYDPGKVLTNMYYILNLT
jgi:hypothetical protein